MPINPNLNMSFRPPQLDNPLENALAAEKLSGARAENEANRNALAEYNSPDAVEGRSQAKRARSCGSIFSSPKKRNGTVGTLGI